MMDIFIKSKRKYSIKPRIFFDNSFIYRFTMFDFYIVSSIEKDIFSLYFKEIGQEPIKNNEYKIVDKNTYNNFIKWLENKIKETSLFDLIMETDDNEYNLLLNCAYLYKDLLKEYIDFNEEYVVFANDW